MVGGGTRELGEGVELRARARGVTPRGAERVERDARLRDGSGALGKNLSLAGRGFLANRPGELFGALGKKPLPVRERFFGESARRVRLGPWTEIGIGRMVFPTVDHPWCGCVSLYN